MGQLLLCPCCLCYWMHGRVGRNCAHGFPCSMHVAGRPLPAEPHALWQAESNRHCGLFGIRRWLRWQPGLTLGPELFQRCLPGCESVLCLLLLLCLHMKHHRAAWHATCSQGSDTWARTSCTICTGSALRTGSRHVVWCKGQRFTHSACQGMPLTAMPSARTHEGSRNC